MKSHRVDRLSEQIKRQLAEIIRQNRSEIGSHFITLTGVKVTKDYAQATIWVSIFGDQSARQHGLRRLNTIRKRLRFLLGSQVRIRRVPELKFKLDETLDSVTRINEIIVKSGVTVDGKDEAESTDE